MSRDDGLKRADTDTSLYQDPKVKRLWRLLKPDVAAMCAAMVLYEATRLESARLGERVSAEDAAPGWMTDTEGPRDSLISAELLDREGRLPEHAYEAWIGAPLARVSRQREVWSRSQARRRGESSESPPGVLDSLASPSLPKPTQPKKPTQPTQVGGDVLDAYFNLTSRRPSKAALDWLNRLEADYGGPATSAALGAAIADDPTTSTLLSRAENRLWTASREASQEKERARVAREAKRQEADAARLSMTPEEVERNRSRLRDELEARGLLSAAPPATSRRKRADS